MNGHLFYFILVFFSGSLFIVQSLSPLLFLLQRKMKEDTGLYVKISSMALCVASLCSIVYIQCATKSGDQVGSTQGGSRCVLYHMNSFSWAPPFPHADLSCSPISTTFTWERESTICHYLMPLPYMDLCCYGQKEK